MSWKSMGESAEQGNEEPAITLGDLRSGERVVLTVEAEPETFESDQYGEGVRVPATFIESDYDHRDDEDTKVREGDDVTLITWSARLVRAMAEYDDDTGGMVGDDVSVTKYGSGYDTEYEVEAAE